MDKQVLIELDKDERNSPFVKARQATRARAHATTVMQAVLAKEVGPEAPTETNAHGGSQAENPFAMHLLPQWALLEIARLLKAAAGKYGRDNWRLIQSEEHLDHSLVHGVLHSAGDTSEGHLGHAVRHACRALFALEMALVEHHTLELGFEDQGCALDPRLRQDSIELTEEGIYQLGKDRRRRTRKGKKRR